MAYKVALREYSRRETWTKVGRERVLLNSTDMRAVNDEVGKAASLVPSKFFVLNDGKSIPAVETKKVYKRSKT